MCVLQCVLHMCLYVCVAVCVAHVFVCVCCSVCCTCVCMDIQHVRMYKCVYARMHVHVFRALTPLASSMCFWARRRTMCECLIRICMSV